MSPRFEETFDSLKRLPDLAVMLDSTEAVSPAACAVAEMALNGTSSATTAIRIFFGVAHVVPQCWGLARSDEIPLRKLSRHI